MRIDYAIDTAAGHVFITCSGALPMDAMLRVIEKVAEDSLFQPRYTITFDLRSGGYTAELSDGDAFAEVLKRRKDHFLNRFAIVVPESLHFLARMYCLLAAMGGFDRMRCFTSMDEALQWCREGHQA